MCELEVWLVCFEAEKSDVSIIAHKLLLITCFVSLSLPFYESNRYSRPLYLSASFKGT